jgi:hypothetical protein
MWFWMCQYVPPIAAQVRVEGYAHCACTVLTLLLRPLVPLLYASMLRQHPLPGTQHCSLQEAGVEQL